MGTAMQFNELANILPNLKEVDLSGFSGTLGAHSFYSCANLETVKLPTSIELPSFVFAQCKKLNTVYKVGKTKITGKS